MELIRSLGRSGALAALALAVALAAGGYALVNTPSTRGGAIGTVAVTGSGSATVKPDTLTVNLAVRTVRSSAKAAFARNNTEAHKVEQAFFGAGVPKQDVQTSNLSLGPVQDSNGKTIGYAAEDDLTVVLRDLAKSGAVISAAESTSGNDVAISDINYSVTHTSPSEAAARAAAMRDALARARGLASAASESVGAIVKITDNSAPQPPEPFVRFGTAVGAGKAPSSVPLQPGTQTVTANIDVTFDLMA